MSLTRTPQLPQLPTVAEAGYAGFEASNWYGVVMRSATPRAIVERLSAEIARGLQAPEVREALARYGVDTAYQNPAEFDAFLRSEAQRNERTVRLLKLKLD